jgi:hypothetical protein
LYQLAAGMHTSIRLEIPRLQSLHEATTGTFRLRATMRKARTGGRAGTAPHEANLTPQILPCRQITSQLRVWPPSAKARSKRSGTSAEVVLAILAPPLEIFWTLIHAHMRRARRTSRLIKGIGQPFIKKCSIPEKKPAGATPPAPSCNCRLALRCRRTGMRLQRIG